MSVDNKKFMHLSYRTNNIFNDIVQLIVSSQISVLDGVFFKYILQAF